VLVGEAVAFWLKLRADEALRHAHRGAVAAADMGYCVIPRIPRELQFDPGYLARLHFSRGPERHATFTQRVSEPG
jgi:hypothetical protein